MKHRDSTMHNENGQHSERCELLTDVVDNACERLQLLQVRVRDGRGETLDGLSRRSEVCSVAQTKHSPRYTRVVEQPLSDGMCKRAQSLAG